MNSYYYNPKTRSFEGTTVLNIETISVDSKRFGFYADHAYESFEAAVDSGHAGRLSFFEDGELKRADFRPAWQYVPITEETQPRFNPGINWGDAYFLSEAAAEEWLAKLVTRHDAIQYDEAHDVYVVHYHY